MASVWDILLTDTTANIHCWVLPNQKGEGQEHRIATRSEKRINSFIAKRDQPGFGTFFCVSTIQPDQPRKKEFARELPWLFADIDFKDTDTAPEEIERILRDLGLPPSRLHHTGNGIHAFWLLDRPALSEDMERAEALLKKLCRYVGGDPTVAHRVALLRVPGTTNSKRGESKPVRVIHETAERYALDELEEWLDGVRDPVIVRRGRDDATDDNPFTRQAGDQAYRPPLDVERALAEMDHGCVHDTQLRVTASLMSAGVDIEEIVALVLGATQALPDTEHWDWNLEARNIRTMCTDTTAKFTPRNGAAAPVSLRDALKEREAKRNAVILDPLDPMRSARAMYRSEYLTEDGKDTLVRHRAEFYKWNGACYQTNAQEMQRGEIWRYLETARVATKDGKTAPFKPKKENVGNVYEALGAICGLDDHIDAPAWIGDEQPPAPANEFFATRNGLLHLPTRKLYAPTASYFGLTASDVAYDPDAAVPAEWLSYLQETVGDEQAIQALQEWMGYSLTADTSQQKILFCIGPKRSGKGTFARIHTALLGKNSVGGPTMASFGLQFGLAPLITKSLAIVSDARIGKKTDRAAVTERLLTISGEDTIDVDRKFNSVWTGRLPTRIAILTNELPAFSEGSGALAGRFLVVIFPNSFFGREDHGLTDRLAHGLPGILNWAVEGYERLRERGHFVQPANAEEQIEAIERLGNPVKAFVQDRCVVGPGQQIETDVLYDDWRAWCMEHGSDPGNKDWFGRNLRAAVPGLSTARPTVDGHRLFVYRGVGIEMPDHVGAAGYRLTQRARST